MRHLVDEDPEVLFRRANRVRRHFTGDDVHLRAVLGISSHCVKDCVFCGMQAANTKMLRHRMDKKEVSEIVRRATEAGIRSITLESGIDNGISGQEIADIVLAAKTVDPSVAITLALGDQPEREFNRWREATADRYQLPFVSSTPRLHKKFVPHSTIEDRIRAIRLVQKSGYQIVSGFIAGLPGQTPDDIADDLLLLKRLDIDLVEIDPFIPHPDTSLANEPQVNIELVLRSLAVARIVMKQIHIGAPITLENLDRSTYLTAFEVGINSISIDITPSRYASHFHAHPGRTPSDVPIAERVQALQRMVKNIGRRLSASRGDAYSFKNKRSPKKRLLPGDLVTIKNVSPSQWLSDQRRKANWS